MDPFSRRSSGVGRTPCDSNIPPALDDDLLHSLSTMEASSVVYVELTGLVSRASVNYNNNINNESEASAKATRALRMGALWLLVVTH